MYVYTYICVCVYISLTIKIYHNITVVFIFMVTIKEFKLCFNVYLYTFHTWAHLYSFFWAMSWIISFLCYITFFWLYYSSHYCLTLYYEVALLAITHYTEINYKVISALNFSFNFYHKIFNLLTRLKLKPYK